MNNTLIRLLFAFSVMALLGQAQPSAPPAVKTSVAVYQIKPAGVEPSLAAAMTSLLVTRLTPSSKLRVIEEAMLKTVMERQGMNASDACDDTSCQVEIGKLVKAQKLVIGDLTKFGSKYILALKLVDIQTGVTDFTTEDSCACAEDQLPDLVTAVAAKLRNHFGENLSVPALPQSSPAARAASAAPLPAGYPTNTTINLNDPDARQILADYAKNLNKTESEVLQDKTTRDVIEKSINSITQAPPIFKAVYHNDLAQVQQLLAQNPALVNAQDSSGTTPLSWAQKIEIAQLLIEKGANVNYIDRNGLTPLMSTQNIEIARLLIEKGANVNYIDKNGNTPLMFTQNIEIARLLIEKGADVNYKGSVGMTPLESAAMVGNKKMVELLISKGADVNAKFAGGTTVLEMVLFMEKNNENQEMQENLRQVSEILVQHGAKRSGPMGRLP